MAQRKVQWGFSLVELSIVLVILGLLTGGILGGQSLMAAAKQRNLMTDVQQHITTFHTFRDKYQAFPGDLPNATAFWGKNNTICPTHTGTVATDGTCNGNGDGIITLNGDIGENTYFWNHLSQAGMVEGPLYNMDWSSAPAVIGVDVPTTAYTGASYVPFTMGDQPATSNFWFEGSYGNVLRYGVPNPSGTCNYCFNRIEQITPEVAWNIDTKMDDGKPGTGKIRTSHGTIGSPTLFCTDTNDSALAGSAGYNLSNPDEMCLLVFIW